MNIRRMLPIGNVLRKCTVCGCQITAKNDALTAHEVECLKIPEAIMWHAEGELIIESFHPRGEIGGNVVVGSIVNRSGGQWRVEIMRFDGDRTYTGTYEACIAFIEGVLGDAEKRKPRPL